MAFATLAANLIVAGNGVADAISLAPFNLEAIAAMGLGGSVVLLFFIFFARVADVCVSRLAHMEGKGHTTHAMARLLMSAVRVVVCWSALTCAVILLLPLDFPIMGADAILCVYAGHYTTTRLSGLVLSLASSLASVSLRVFGCKKLFVRFVVIIFMADVGLNWVFLHGSAHVLSMTLVLAVGVATIVAQIFAGSIGWSALARHPRGTWSTEKEKTSVGTEPPEFDYGASVFKISSGVDVRQMSNYVVAVLPFLMILSPGIGMVMVTTVATKLWTICYRALQAVLGATGTFLGYTQGESAGRAHSSVRRIFYPHVVTPNILAGTVILVLTPQLNWLFEDEEVWTNTMFLLFVAFMPRVPLYPTEQYPIEILTPKQERTVVVNTSTAVTHAVTTPITVTGILVWQSTFISFLSTAAASAALALRFTCRMISVGYHYRALRETTR